MTLNFNSNNHINQVLFEGGNSYIFELNPAHQIYEYFPKPIFKGMKKDGESWPFFNEYYVLKQINTHPNIVQLLGFFPGEINKSEQSLYFSHPFLDQNFGNKNLKDSQPFLILNKSTGEPLDKFFQNKELDDEKILQVFIKALYALSAIHFENWVHGDISFNNLLVDKNFHLTLIDFGLANIENTEPKGTTLQFCPPELFKDGTKAHSSQDVYSLCLAFLKILQPEININPQSLIKIDDIHLPSNFQFPWLTLFEQTILSDAEQRISVHDIFKIITEWSEKNNEALFNKCFLLTNKALPLKIKNINAPKNLDPLYPPIPFENLTLQEEIFQELFAQKHSLSEVKFWLPKIQTELDYTHFLLKSCPLRTNDISLFENFNEQCLELSSLESSTLLNQMLNTRRDLFIKNYLENDLNKLAKSELQYTKIEQLLTGHERQVLKDKLAKENSSLENEQLVKHYELKIKKWQASKNAGLKFHKFDIIKNRFKGCSNTEHELNFAIQNPTDSLSELVLNKIINCSKHPGLIAQAKHYLSFILHKKGKNQQALKLIKSNLTFDVSMFLYALITIESRDLNSAKAIMKNAEHLLGQQGGNIYSILCQFKLGSFQDLTHLEKLDFNQLDFIEKNYYLETFRVLALNEKNLHSGVEILKKKLALFSNNKNENELSFYIKEALGKYHSTLGYFYHHLNDFKKSEYHYNLSIRLAIQINNKNSQTLRILNRGVLYQKQLKFEQALKDFSSARTYADCYSQGPAFVNSLALETNLNLWLGRIEKARNLLNSHQQFKKTKNITEDFQIYNLECTIYENKSIESLLYDYPENSENDLNQKLLRATHYYLIDDYKSLDEMINELSNSLSELVKYDFELNYYFFVFNAKNIKKELYQTALNNLILKQEDQNKDFLILILGTILDDNFKNKVNQLKLNEEYEELLHSGLDTTKLKFLSNQLKKDLKSNLFLDFKNAPLRKKTWERIEELTLSNIGNDSFATILRFNSELAQSQNLDQTLNMVIDYAKKLASAAGAVLLLKSPDTHELVVFNPKKYKNEELQFSITIATEAAETGLPVYSFDAQKDSRYKNNHSVHHLNLKSVIALPLLHAKGTLGALYLDRKKGSGLLTESEINTLNAFANQASIIIQYQQNLNALLNEKKSSLALTQAVYDLKNEIKLSRISPSKEKLEFSTHLKNYDSYMFGNTELMKNVLKMIKKVGPKQVPIFIKGETGTGKEGIAQLIANIYNASKGVKNKKPFIAINCGALPAKLFESELFGHKKGSFTGAHADKIGLLEYCKDGTLFLDEIGELPEEMQSKLLRVLQERTFRRIGDHKEIKFSGRLISASHKDIKNLNSFRKDLFFRIAVVEIEIPALKNRTEDIPALAEYFLKQQNKLHKKSISLSPQLKEQLKLFHWPGNIRQLSNFIEQMVILSENAQETLTQTHFEKLLLNSKNNDVIISENFSELIAQKGLKGVVKWVEKEVIRQTMNQNEGNTLKSAEQLNITRATLYKKSE